MIERAGPKVAAPLARFVEERALAGTTIAPEALWEGVAAIAERFAPQIRRLRDARDELQAAIDARYLAGEPVDGAFLRAIGYLVAQVARIAGRQHVVPALDGADARGKPVDALDGTDAIPRERRPGCGTSRGTEVIARATDFYRSGGAVRDGKLDRPDWRRTRAFRGARP